jgi:RNA polymerase sigma factor (sigma-70 family)
VNDAVGMWMDGAGRVPLLTPAEELHLGTLVQRWQQWPGGADLAPAAVRRRGLRARDRMVAANLRLVVAVAKKYQRYAAGNRVEFVDLLQAGAIGLQRGAEKFDPERGYKFSTYAFHWIRQALPREVWRGGVVKIPQGVGERLQRLQPGELMALPAGERAQLQAAIQMRQVVALDAAVSDDGSALGELIAADDGDALEALHWQQLADEVAAADPEAWALGLAQVERPRGVNRSVVERLRSA